MNEQENEWEAEEYTNEEWQEYEGQQPAAECGGIMDADEYDNFGVYGVDFATPDVELSKYSGQSFLDHHDSQIVTNIHAHTQRDYPHKPQPSRAPLAHAQNPHQQAHGVGIGQIKTGQNAVGQSCVDTCSARTQDVQWRGQWT